MKYGHKIFLFNNHSHVVLALPAKESKKGLLRYWLYSMIDAMQGSIEYLEGFKWS